MKDRLVSLPHPNLRKNSKKVGYIGDEIKQLIADMKATTIDWESSRDHEVGVALAAVQIDELWRVVVVRNDFDDKNDHTFHVLINPVITKYEGDVEEDFEGCLSVKNIYGKVPRNSKIRLKALNESGREIRLTAEGFLARVLQHEVDHTNGIVFVDHIKDDPAAFYTLTSEGKLEELDYDNSIKNNSDLWD